MLNARLPLFYLLACVCCAYGQNAPILIDTDAGSDDVMAIAYLLAHPTVRIEAVTVVNGMAHPEAGARNIARLIELSGRRRISVFAGRDTPLSGHSEFPAEWRKVSDELPGVQLPNASRPPESQPAADYLLARLRNKRNRVRILALGPLTNLAEVLERAPASASAIEELVIMGGAVRVPGNLGDGGFFKTDNTTAEWNIFVDPRAARVVFRSGIPIRLIPLDATNKVPLGPPFVKEFDLQARSPLGQAVAQVLAADRETIEQGIFYAWDPLAAVAFLEPGVVKTSPLHIEIRQDAEPGRTFQSPGKPNAQVALDADAAAFRRLFMEAFLR